MKKLEFETINIDKEAMIEDLMEDDDIRSFLLANDLGVGEIEPALSKLLAFRIENDKCKGCKGLHECRQDMVGMRPELLVSSGKIQSYYKECHYYQNERSKQTSTSHIDAMYMPKMIYEADLSDYDFKRGENRMDIHNKITNFLTMYERSHHQKGMYLWGEYQKGKTFIMAALANELSKRGAKVLIAYYPDLVREMKSRIGNQTLESLISKLKGIDVLMLDDIGGEAQSAWIRDEVLGPILQHRLLDEKPTFFTSNVNQKDLLTYLITNSQSAEKMKAARIIARIRSLADEVKM